MTTLQERIDELVTRHGSLRAVARVTMIDAGYLSRLRTGEKVNPEKGTLKRLGLRRVVSYERIGSPRSTANASRSADRRQHDFEAVPTTVDYDNDCAP